MSEKCLLTLIIMLGSAAMIAARRYKNNDSDAGYGIAGWTIFIIIFLVN